jgi:hypothetical protein
MHELRGWRLPDAPGRDFSKITPEGSERNLSGRVTIHQIELCDCVSDLIIKSYFKLRASLTRVVYLCPII